MQALSLGRVSVPVPSPAVLRFLKIQAECLPFVASQSQSQVRRHHHHAAPNTFRPNNRTCLHDTRAPLNTVQQHSLASSSRGFWNSAAKSRWQRPWQQVRPKKTSPLQPNDLPAIPRLLDDAGAASLGRIVKPTNELRMRCTEFDGNGNVTLINGAFKKSELIAKCGLLPRDLRKIDSGSLPHILVRPSAILIKILHISCLINHNRVLVFDAYGTTDSHTQSIFMSDLEAKLQLREERSAGTLPYEFRALEAVLISVTSALEGEFEGVREPVVQVLRELEEDIDRNKLRHLLIYSKKLGTFEQKARLVRDAIDDLLEADDDLTDMYLTEIQSGVIRAEDEHTEVEMLLESYHKVCDEIVQASSNLVSNIRNTEEIVKAILDANRNSLMLLDLQFTILALGIGVGTFFAGLYGMNLKNFVEESDFGFPLVSMFCGFFCMVAIVWGLRKLRKVQRLSMWGESGSLAPEPSSRRGRGSWREVEPPSHLSGETRVGHMARWKQEQRMNKMQEGSKESL